MFGFRMQLRMSLPYGLTQRCLQALAASWVVSSILGFVLGGGWTIFFYLAVVSLPGVAVYSFMNVSGHFQFLISN